MCGVWGFCWGNSLFQALDDDVLDLELGRVVRVCAVGDVALGDKKVHHLDGDVSEVIFDDFVHLCAGFGVSVGVTLSMYTLFINEESVYLE